MVSKAPIPFRGFNEHVQVRMYSHGILPHWRQAGCTYFVTFRLADSIPERVLKQVEYERTLWLKSRSINPAAASWKQLLAKLTAGERRQYEQLIGRMINASLDECHGSCVLRDRSIADRVASALDHFHGSRVLTGDFVIMPNHVHALLIPLDGFELEDILHSIKSYTAHGINRALDQAGRLWQRETYDHIVRDAEQLVAYQEYIAGNPSKAKLKAGEYVVSRAEYVIVAP